MMIATKMALKIYDACAAKRQAACAAVKTEDDFLEWERVVGEELELVALAYFHDIAPEKTLEQCRQVPLSEIRRHAGQ